MNKEEGNFYTFGEAVGKTKVRSLAGEEGASLFYLTSTSRTGRSELTVVEVSETDFNPACLLSLKFDLILADALVLKTKSGHLLFGIGYENAEKVGKESVYFAQEIELVRGQKSEALLRPVLKSKKVNFTGVAAAGDAVFVTAAFEVYRYSLAEMKMEAVWEAGRKKPGAQLGPLKWDPKNRRLIVSQKNGLAVLDESFQPVSLIERAHDNAVSCVDFNANRSGQLLSCANEPFLKFWDLRNPVRPNHLIEDHNSVICQGAFNSFYDQLVLSATLNGSVVVNSVYSVSSAVLLKGGDDRQTPENRKLKTFDSALDDHVNSVAWSAVDAWTFAAGAANKAYFDLLPQKLKFETMF